MTTWGIVATIKAGTEDTLNFVAHHLSLGADEVHIYLDEPNPEAEAILKATPRVKVINCDAAYWRRRRPYEEHQRPPMHQGRQFANAKWAYKRCKVDWLAHIDVDEFLWPARPVAEQLAELPAECLCARLRPIEALAPDPSAPSDMLLFKSCAESWEQRLAETRAIYPTYGEVLNGGFLSHVAGKLFVRTGLENIRFKIHNLETEQGLNPGERPLPDTDLLHLHADSWEHWIATYRYRKDKGSYRSELAPPTQPPGVKQRDPLAPNLHQLFAVLEQDKGEAGLRHFFTEVCTATPDLTARLDQFGYLRRVPLDLAATRHRVFGR